MIAAWVCPCKTRTTRWLHIAAFLLLVVVELRWNILRTEFFSVQETAKQHQLPVSVGSGLFYQGQNQSTTISTSQQPTTWEIDIDSTTPRVISRPSSASPRIWVQLTFSLEFDQDLMSHTVDHFVNTLGADPDRVLIALHHKDPNGLDSQTIVDHVQKHGGKLGIGKLHCQIHNSTNAWQNMSYTGGKACGNLKRNCTKRGLE